TLCCMSIRRNLGVLAASTIAAFALNGATTLASSSDVASTNAYVQANYTLLLAAKSHLHAAENAPLTVLAQIRRECPAAAAESPQDANSTQLSNELIGMIVLASYHLDVAAGERFVRSVTSLHWANRRLAGVLGGYARNLRTLAKLAPPHLCADIRAWVSSGYKTLPASTVAFDAKFMPAWVAIGLLPHQLSAYESSAQKGVLARSRAIEVQIGDVEARDVDKWGNIMTELGLQP
ncbi:MAG TPA: hypothetical protein VII03_05195, partial [Solirubrobacteraceae bacterium]